MYLVNLPFQLSIQLSSTISTISKLKDPSMPPPWHKIYPLDGTELAEIKK